MHFCRILYDDIEKRSFSRHIVPLNNPIKVGIRVVEELEVEGDTEGMNVEVRSQVQEHHMNSMGRIIQRDRLNLLKGCIGEEQQVF